MSCRSRYHRVVTVSAAGDTVEEAEARALLYVARLPGERATVLAHRRRRIRLGILGYRVWDFRIRVES